MFRVCSKERTDQPESIGGAEIGRSSTRYVHMHGRFYLVQKHRYTIAQNLALQHPYLATTGPILLAKDDHLELVIHRKDTSTRNSAKDVGAGTLEEGLGALLGDDLLESIH